STFLRILLDQESPTSGSIEVDGELFTGEPCPTRGIVFQRYSVFPHMTVRANIVAATAFSQGTWGWLFGDEKRKAQEEAQTTLDRIGLGHVALQYPASLSGGMQQRLAIAQALAGKPRILLLDEPFGALDPGTRLSMHEFLEQLRNETGMTVFMVTHDLEEAFKLGDRVLVFDKPVWDPENPETNAATITYDFDARNNGIPFQALQENTNVFKSD
ncbi:MAG: ATP-binding cassette domain-containing protein, partial [Pseudomonadota bacterium]